MDPNRNAKALAKERKKELTRRLGRPINLDGAYEDVSVPARDVAAPRGGWSSKLGQQPAACRPRAAVPTALPCCCCLPQVVAQAVINPRNIDVTLADVGGLDHIIDVSWRQPGRLLPSLLLSTWQHLNIFHLSVAGWMVVWTAGWLAGCAERTGWLGTAVVGCEWKAGPPGGLTPACSSARAPCH